MRRRLVRTTARTPIRITAGARRLMPDQTLRPAPLLPEALALRLENVVFGQAAGEAQEPRVRHHPVRRPQAPAPHRPAALEHLEHLHQPEAPHLPQAVEE